MSLVQQLQQQALELAGGDPTLAAQLLEAAAAHAEQMSTLIERPCMLPEVIDMIDWSSADKRVVGYWVHCCPTEIEAGFCGEYIPYSLHGKYKRVAEGGDEYWRFYLPCTKSKKIYSRQLLQDLRSDALSFFDVHHKNGKSKNCVVDLEVILAKNHRQKHGREGGLTNRGRGKGPKGKVMKRFR